jgi:hypothetical protein
VLDIKNIRKLNTEENSGNLARKGQPSFKKNRSTTTLSAELQFIIARALDNNEYVLMSNLDLSTAFDVVILS